jgi:NAD(P)-dependent dehydrogenase (short-subunit alcohol dehydrogenase family)
VSTADAVAPLVLRQPPVGDVAAVGRALDDAFAALREAVPAGRPVIVVLRDDDLLGQRSPEDAALAAALLGMVRALAMEGARAGWQVNAVSHRDGDRPLEETLRWLGTAPGVTGQLLRVTTDHLGRVWP